ncbi:MAG: hypothetical protein HOJ57_10860 [Lentisphaerae bacterium]|nr:hypothetical protein [Lentisphaerota bacterium]
MIPTRMLVSCGVAFVVWGVVARCPGADLAPSSGPNPVLTNASFEQGCGEDGVPIGWTSPTPGKLQVVPAAPGNHVLKIAKGGVIAQETDASPGWCYTVTLRAHTSLAEEKKNFRYRSHVYFEAAFLPSGTKSRTEMASPFGVSREYVDYTVGGTAPAGTERIRITVSARGAETRVDDLRVVTHRDSYEHLRLKDLHLDTALVRNGAAKSAIVLPVSGEYDQLAERIVRAIEKRTGVRLPVVQNTALDLCASQRLDRHLIVLGNRSTNRVISNLYDMYHCIVDLRYPGQGGSVVRTLHDPFGDGHNVVLVGASDRDGMVQATETLAAKLEQTAATPGELTLGRIAAIQLGSDVDIPERMTFQQLKRVKPWDATNRTGGYGWTVLTKCLAYYYLTGYEFYAQEFLRLAFPRDKETVADLASCGQDFKTDKSEPLVEVYHYRAHLPVVYWDLVEESPVFTDEIRAKVTRQFMKQVKRFRANTDYGCGTDKTRYPTDVISTRHHQWGAMTFYTLGRYLGKSYPDYEWKAVKRAAELFFSPIYLKERVTNRGESARLARYPTTLVSLFDYTLMSGNKQPVVNGSLADQTRIMEILLDWEPNAWVLRQAPTNLFHKMAYLLDEQRYAHLPDLITVNSDLFRPGQTYWPDDQVRGDHPFGMGRWERAQPTRFDTYFWELLWDEPLPDKERMFRISSFRTSNDGNGDFLLFDGVFLGGVYHAFSMLEYVLNGDVLFMGHRTHLNVVSDGMTAAKLPKYARLSRADTCGSSAYISAVIPDYSFADWTRTVLHRSGESTLVIDQLLSRRDSAFNTIEVNWQLGEDAEAKLATPGTVTVHTTNPNVDSKRYKFSALGDRSVEIRSNLPGDKIMRSSYDALTLLNHDAGNWLDMSFDLQHAVEGEMVAVFVRSGNRGLVRLSLDGTVLADSIDGACSGSQKTPFRVHLGRRRLAAGRHVLRLESLGRAPESTGAFISFRGFSVVDRLETREYSLSFSDKVDSAVRDMGTAIGSAASGGLITFPWTGPLHAGKARTFFSLIAPQTGEAEGESNACIRIAQNAAALTINGSTSIAVAGEHGDLFGQLVVAGTDRLTAVGATRCGEFVGSDQPVDVDWEFGSGRLAINADSTCTVTIALAPGVMGLEQPGITVLDGNSPRKQVVLQPGRYTLRGAKPHTAVAQAHRQVCRKELTEAAAKRQEAPVVQPDPVQVGAPDLATLWSVEVGDFPLDLEAFTVAGKPCVAVAAGTSVLVFNGDGKLQSTLEADATVRVIHYWVQAGLLVAGCQDFKVIAYDLDTGQRKWTFESTDMNPTMKKAGASGWFDRNPVGNRGIHALHSGVFLGNKSQLLVGTASTVEALNTQGDLVKSMSAGAGVVTDVALLPGSDGEVKLFPAKLFGRFQLHHTSNGAPDKVIMFSVGAFAPRRGAATYASEYGNGYTDLEAIDVTGDGVEELVGLFNGTLNGLHVWGHEGSVLGDAAFGDGSASPMPSPEKRIEKLNMRGLSIADLNGDGSKEICVVTARGFLIVLTPRCDVVWTRRLPSEPLCLRAFPSAEGLPGCVAVGCRAGSLYTLDPQGAFTGHAEIAAAPVRMVQTDETTVAVATEKGILLSCRAR